MSIEECLFFLHPFSLLSFPYQKQLLSSVPIYKTYTKFNSNTPERPGFQTLPSASCRTLLCDMQCVLILHGENDSNKGKTLEDSTYQQYLKIASCSSAPRAQWFYLYFAV